jgi:hypothetical protein
VIPKSVRTYYEWSHFQTNRWCDKAEADAANVLLVILAETSEKLCTDFPTICNKRAHETNRPLTDRVTVDAEESTFKTYGRLSQHAVKEVSNAF